MSFSFEDVGSSSTAVDASMGDMSWDTFVNSDMFDGENMMSPAPNFAAKQDTPSFNERIKRETSLLPQQQMSGPTHNYSEYRQATGVVVDPLALQTTLQATQHTGYNSYGSIETIPEEPFDFNSPVSQLTPFSAVSPMVSQFNNSFADASGMDMPYGSTPRSLSISSSGADSGPTVPHNQVYPGIHTRQAQFQSQGQKMQNAMEQQRRAAYSQERQFLQSSQSSAGSMRSTPQASISSSSSGAKDSLVERTISQLLQRARTASAVPPTPNASDEAELERLAKEARKEQEEMDEDERLLNSEEGKALPSTKRRQLRNKVSARHFRLRRKEHIEGLTTENATLKAENENLRTENAGLTGFVQQLLRAPEFKPFLARVTREQATQQLQQQAVQQQMFMQQQPQFSQQQRSRQISQPQTFDMFQDLDVHLVQAPEVNFGDVLSNKLDMPEPLDLGVMSGKTTNFVGSVEEFDVDEEKTDMPVVEHAPSAVEEPVVDTVDTVVDEEFENDPAFALYRQDVAPAPEAEVVAVEPEQDTESMAMEELQRRSASLEGVCERLMRMTT